MVILHAANKNFTMPTAQLMNKKIGRHAHSVQTFLVTHVFPVKPEKNFCNFSISGFWHKDEANRFNVKTNPTSGL